MKLFWPSFRPGPSEYIYLCFIIVYLSHFLISRTSPGHISLSCLLIMDRDNPNRKRYRESSSNPSIPSRTRPRQGQKQTVQSRTGSQTRPPRTASPGSSTAPGPSTAPGSSTATGLFTPPSSSTPGGLPPFSPARTTFAPGLPPTRPVQSDGQPASTSSAISVQDRQAWPPIQSVMRGRRPATGLGTSTAMS